MIVKRLLGAALTFLWTMSPASSRGQDAPPVFHYPEAPRASTVEDYHGVKVADPYRPLEDPDATATRAWVEAENKITFAFLEGIRQRPAIRARLTALWDYEKFSPPGDRRRALLLHVQHGPAKPERALRDRLAGCSAPDRFWTPIRCRRMARSPLPEPRRARTANCWPTAPPRRARTGTNGRSATSPPART